MCGIIGYIGNRNAVPILLDSLKKLEYRGYDSCGFAIINDKKEIEIKKGAGRIDFVNKRTNFELLKSFIGIAHTRWATHGKVEDNNAHPFISCDGEYALIHNGIVENYFELKNKLQKKGHKFQSETDTEVLVHLIEDKMKQNLDKNVIGVIREVSNEVKGAFTFLLLDRNSNEIYAFRKDSPLIIGLGKEEFFAASDITAFLQYTNKALILENNQLAILNKNCNVFDIAKGKQIQPEIITINWSPEQATKNGYPHFMLKEIF